MKKYLTLILTFFILTSAHADMSNSDKSKAWDCVGTVSYTHLTLPTNREV